MTTAESHHNQGHDELERLGQGLRKYGRLQYVTQENDARYGGPVLLVFRKHIPQSVIAAPGTRSDPEAEPSATWRVFSRKQSSTPERSTVRLTDIVDNLPGEIADWALTVQRSIIDQALPAGEEQNNLQLELSAAERVISNCGRCESSYWPSRAPRYVHVRAGAQDSRQTTGLRDAPVSVAA